MVWLQKGSIFGPKGLKISKNNVWILYKTLFKFQVSQTIFKPILSPQKTVLLQEHRYIVRLLNGFKYCLRDLNDSARFIDYPNIIL